MSPLSTTRKGTAVPRANCRVKKEQITIPTSNITATKALTQICCHNRFRALNRLPLYTAFTSEVVLKLTLIKKEKQRLQDTYHAVLVETIIRLYFLFAQYFSEHVAAFGAFIQSDFELHPFSSFIWSSSQFPGFLWLRYFCSAFWTFRHLIFLRIIASMLQYNRIKNFPCYSNRYCSY